MPVYLDSVIIPIVTGFIPEKWSKPPDRRDSKRLFFSGAVATNVKFST
ncbi:hypothetical protein NZK35_22310 [Stieleria sp. ICT_E10.1]|nr:hypothetical protein [Stieleria sedimenti]MCS7469395.1 hypothetical protein [Stieleria sedimenti]